MIVNADDLGLSDGVNAGILEAHANGIVTSASLMVERTAAGAAVEGAREHPRLGLGLHLDLDEVGDDPEDVRHACQVQLEAFRALTGGNPTHVDSHHHAHLRGPASRVAGELADGLGVPLRGREIRYEGRYFGRDAGRSAPEMVAPERLLELVASLPPGWTEIGCHPGRAVGAESSYAHERELELEALCDPAVAAALAGAKLRTFADFARETGLPPRRSLDSGVDGER